jgi:glutathione S-transferase
MAALSSGETDAEALLHDGLAIRARGSHRPAREGARLRSRRDGRDAERRGTQQGLVDGDLHLWESAVIIDYLMKTYPNARRTGEKPFAAELVRPAHEWQDKLALATVQTLGASTTTVSQMHWTGIRHEGNAHLARCAARNQHVLDWCESRLGAEDGFVPGVVSAQDVLLACFCAFIEKRPLNLQWDSPMRPKVRALVERLGRRASFVANPVFWWEPGITGYQPDGTPIREAATVS